MLSLIQIKEELDTAGTLKYIRLRGKNQHYYYDYKNLSIVLRYNIQTDTIDYISVTRKETTDNDTNNN